MEIIFALQLHIYYNDYANGLCAANRNMNIVECEIRKTNTEFTKNQSVASFLELSGGFLSISNKIFMIQIDINGKPNNSSV